METELLQMPTELCAIAKLMDEQKVDHLTLGLIRPRGLKGKVTANFYCGSCEVHSRSCKLNTMVIEKKMSCEC